MSQFSNLFNDQKQQPRNTPAKMAAKKGEERTCFGISG